MIDLNPEKNLKPPYTIYEKEWLKVTSTKSNKSSQTSDSSSSNNKITTNTYTVKSGDVLSIIAQRSGNSVADLQRWNNLSNPNKIRVGQILTMVAPAGGSSSTSKQSNKGSGSSKARQAADYARRRAEPRSKGLCARYVRKALQDGGGYKFDRQPSAYMYHSKDIMTAMGFTQIDKDSTPKKGDVVVWPAHGVGNGGGKHGHIAIF